MSRVVRHVLVAVVALVVAACSGLDTEYDNRGSALENGVFGDIRARKPRPVDNGPKGLIPIDTSTGKSLIFSAGGADAAAVGATAFAGGALAPPEVMAEAGAFRLNYENAEIKDVVHAVLGEALGLNYTISPDVAGTMTVSTARPVGRSELLTTLEAMLSIQGYSLTKSGSVYKVAPMIGGTGGVVDRGARTQPGYGVSVVPLRYASSRTIARLLAGFVVDSEGLRVDTTRNAILVAGPAPRRDEAVQTILSFDEDWMKDQTVGIFELRRAKPETVIGELEQIFDTRSGGSGLIQFKAITRLNAVMAISRNANLIRRAETSIRRLDDTSLSVGENVFVYKARYRASKELASIVSGLFGGGGGGGAASAAPEPSGDTGGDLGDGFSDGTGGAATGDDVGAPGAGLDTGGEPPIDNLTGAGAGFGQEGEPSSGAPPDVIDLTRQGNAGASIRISADVANNSVITYTDATTYKKILAALQQLDAAPTQVAINVTIAEVRLNNELKYGVQAAVKSGSLGFGDDEGSIGLQQVAGALAPQIPGFNLLVGSQSNPDLIISALDRVTDVEVLSSPTLMVIENQTATLQVGDQIPVEVRQTQSTDTDRLISEVEYRDTGIILKVTPRIGDNGAVTMDIAQEISSVVNSSNNRPTISRRRVASFISVIDGQTVVLAGLITTGRDKTRNGVPFLARLPGGDLLGRNEKTGIRTELVILIRPQIVRSGEDAQSVAEDLRSRMWAIGTRETQNPR